jgi:hypothetical protein
MRALNLAESSQEKKKLDLKCKEWLSRAEVIKTSGKWKTPGPGKKAPVLKEPVSSKKLSTREEIILLESAKLNKFVFPPWKETPDSKEFELEQDGQKFESVNFIFSFFQVKVHSNCGVGIRF